MAERDLEIVRRAMEANRSGPPEATLEVEMALIAPEFEFVSRLTRVEGAVYRGQEGARRYFADLTDAWKEWRNELHSIEEIAPGRILTEFTFHATAQSGVGVALRSAGVFAVSEDGLVTGIYVSDTREEALAAAEAGS